MVEIATSRPDAGHGYGRRAGWTAGLADAVADFGEAVRIPLSAGIGQPEEQIGAPAAALVRDAGSMLGLPVVTHAEVPLAELSVRPDFAIDVADGGAGYIEVKRPGKGADPAVWSARSHDGKQWRSLRLLPNVLYTDGREWSLYRNGIRYGSIARLDGDLARAGRSLRPADGELARVLEEFLRWAPPRPRTLRELVGAAARLCRYLRDEIVEVLEHERRTPGERPFSTLADEWRQILFPRMTDAAAFADAYAQTVTFALLLARSAGISFDGQDLAGIGRKLGKQHALIGKALGVMANPAAADSIVVIETLRRVIGAVDWDQLGYAAGDVHATLYEKFLQEYDSDLRRQSGSYYTPDRLARVMVEFTDRVLRSRLERPWGYAADDVIVVDPAMGTGTFLVEIVDLVAETVADQQGAGARAQRLRELVSRRLIGFERQVTPYAVAELRLHEALRTRYGVDVPEHEMRFLADTFEDPRKQELAFGSMYAELKRSREEANRVKLELPVMAVIGNPPYLDRAHQRDSAPWVEERRDPREPGGVRSRPSLDEFRTGSRLDYKLAATWVFYWRWAIWKAFEAHPDEPAGVVAFITPRSYLTGSAFAGMRAYLRRITDEGWIIDVSPEGHQPPVRSRLFRGVQQPLCIGVFARRRSYDAATPATVHHRVVRGTGEEKIVALEGIAVDGPGWRACPDGWGDPFVPAGGADWRRFTAIADLLPWHAPGLKAKRTWVIAPDRDVLRRRWATLTRSPASERNTLLKATPDRTLDSDPPPIPGVAPPLRPLRDETEDPHIVPFAYRSFDRQYLILDPRVIDRPSPTLWAADGPAQVYVSEQHTRAITGGPGLTFAALVPDMDHFEGHHGGRVLPLYRDLAGSPNVAPGLLDHLARVLGRPVTAEDLLAYVAAVVAHPAFTDRFRDDLAVPGVRVPLSGDGRLWGRAVGLGREVIWLHTFGARYVDAGAGRPARPPRLPAAEAPRIVETIPADPERMPDDVSYDEATETLHVGAGQIRPVRPGVWHYTTGGGPPSVVKKWVGYRMRRPRGRPAPSPLKQINATTWTARFNNDLLDLLHVLGRLTLLEPDQAALLDQVCAAPLVCETDLSEAGVLPVPRSARKVPRSPRNGLF